MRARETIIVTAAVIGGFVLANIVVDAFTVTGTGTRFLVRIAVQGLVLMLVMLVSMVRDLERRLGDLEHDHDRERRNDERRRSHRNPRIQLRR